MRFFMRDRQSVENGLFRFFACSALKIYLMALKWLHHKFHFINKRLVYPENFSSKESKLTEIYALKVNAKTPKMAFFAISFLSSKINNSKNLL